MLSVDFMIQLMDRFGDGHLGRLASRLPIHGQAEEGVCTGGSLVQFDEPGGYKEKNNDEQSIPPGFQIWIYIYLYMIITYDLLSILQNRVQPQVCKIALFQHISYGIMIPNRRVPVRVWSNGLCAPSVFGCYDSSILSISPDDELKYDSWLVLWDFGDGLASQVFKCTTKKEETAMYIVSYRRAVCRLCRQASSCPQWGLFIHVIVWSLCLCTLGH